MTKAILERGRQGGTQYPRDETATKPMADDPIIDVDDPAFSYDVDPITAHSRIAQFYQYRPPYLPAFFQVIAKKLDLSPRTVLLDLCCGRGELASQFAQFVKYIFAVDGSEEMLIRQIPRSNIGYIKKDVDNDDLKLPEKVDHVVIGSAIHWISQSSLLRIFNDYKNIAGLVLIGTTNYDITDREYSAALQAVNQQFGKTGHKLDYFGYEKMARLGYKPLDRVRLTCEVDMDLEYLFRVQLSYLYREFYQRVTVDFQAYRREFISRLSPSLKNGKLSATLVNFAVIYAPSNRDASGGERVAAGPIGL